MVDFSPVCQKTAPVLILAGAVSHVNIQFIEGVSSLFVTYQSPPYLCTHSSNYLQPVVFWNEVLIASGCSGKIYAAERVCELAGVLIE